MNKISQEHSAPLKTPNQDEILMVMARHLDIKIKKDSGIVTDTITVQLLLNDEVIAEDKLKINRE